MPGVTVYFTHEYKVAGYKRQKFAKLVRSICARFGLENVTVDIAIVDNGIIRKLNGRFLNRKTTTDCLSFDLSQPDKDNRLFELVVNGERAKEEAARRGHPARDELALYITHGLLHLLGFNDQRPAQAKKMHALEDEILMQHGFVPAFNRKTKIVHNSRRRKC